MKKGGNIKEKLNSCLVGAVIYIKATHHTLRICKQKNSTCIGGRAGLCCFSEGDNYINLIFFLGLHVQFSLLLASYNN